MTPYLSDAEVAGMCSPLTQPAAVRRFLKRCGVPFIIRPDGRPIVARRAVDEALYGSTKHAGTAGRPKGPDAAALAAVFSKKKG